MARDATASAPAQGVSEDTYEALLATLSSSALGRSFLAEYARRNRAADTETLLAAMARLEAMIVAQSEPPAAEPVAAATADALVKPELVESAVEPAIEEEPVVDAEIPVVAWEMPPVEAPAASALDASTAEPPAEAPTALQCNVAGEAMVEAVALSPDTTEEAAPPRDEPEAAMPPRDPLEQIMALSEEERIALFS
jgi:hypothetical protein